MASSGGELARCETLMDDVTRLLADENAHSGLSVPVELTIAQQVVKAAATLGKQGDDVDGQTLARAVVNINKLLAQP